MTGSRLSRRVLTLLLVLGGPCAIGAALGMPFGLRKLFTEAALLPAIVLGVALFMIPALYIATTLMGAAPPAERVVSASVSALRSAGTVLLGLAPATVFLLATSQTRMMVWILGSLVLAASMLVSLRILFSDLFDTGGLRVRALPAFLLWTVVSLGLGAHLFARSLRHVAVQPAVQDTAKSAVLEASEGVKPCKTSSRI